MFQCYIYIFFLNRIISVRYMGAVLFHPYSCLAMPHCQLLQGRGKEKRSSGYLLLAKLAAYGNIIQAGIQLLYPDLRKKAEEQK